jgi:hypothetical protein
LSGSDVVRVKLIKEELRTLVEEVGRAKKISSWWCRVPNRRVSQAKIGSWRTFILVFTGGRGRYLPDFHALVLQEELGHRPLPRARYPAHGLGTKVSSKVLRSKVFVDMRHSKKTYLHLRHR